MLIVFLTILSLVGFQVDDVKAVENDINTLAEVSVKSLNRPEPNDIYGKINWLENTFACAVNGLLGKSSNLDVKRKLFADFQKFVQILETIKSKLRRALLDREKNGDGIEHNAEPDN